MAIYVYTPLDVKLAPENQSVNLGSSVNYTCKSSVTSSVIYQWLHNDTILENETNEILNIINAQWGDAGVYQCIVTTANNVSEKSNNGKLVVSESDKESM